MPDSPERLAVIRRMRDIISEDRPWIIVAHRITELLSYDHVRNLKPSSAIDAPVKYYRVEGRK
jgi:hypothetical protein